MKFIRMLTIGSQTVEHKVFMIHDRTAQHLRFFLEIVASLVQIRNLHVISVPNRKQARKLRLMQIVISSQRIQFCRNLTDTIYHRTATR